MDKSDINKSFKNFLERFNSLLDLHAPYKKISKCKLKFKDKPWIISGTQKPISVKYHYLQKFFKLKNPHIRTEAQNKHKTYRNLIPTLLKHSKQSYFINSFQENIKDLKNTWKSSNLTYPNAIIDNNATLTNPITLANASTIVIRNGKIETQAVLLPFLLEREISGVSIQRVQ